VKLRIKKRDLVSQYPFNIEQYQFEALAIRVCDRRAGELQMAPADICNEESNRGRPSKAMSA
jgi:hypothetical protein